MLAAAVAFAALGIRDDAWPDRTRPRSMGGHCKPALNAVAIHVCFFVPFVRYPVCRRIAVRRSAIARALWVSGCAARS